MPAGPADDHATPLPDGDVKGRRRRGYLSGELFGPRTYARLVSCTDKGLSMATSPTCERGRAIRLFFRSTARWACTIWHRHFEVNKMINVPDDFAAKMLNDLAPREREVLGLIYLNDFDVADAAQLLAMKPDSVSAYLNRGRKKIGRMLNATAEEAGGLLSGLGQVRADRHRPVTLRSEMRGGLQTSVTIAPHRCVIGSAIREDEHLEMDLTRYFVTAIDGKVASAVEAEHWFRRRPMSFGLSIKREILVSKGIKAAEAFDRESLGYFFPVGFGCAELYFERNFEHKGDKVVAAVDQASRPVWLLDVWNLRLLDLGEYQKRYEDDLAAEIETVIRRRQP